MIRLSLIGIGTGNPEHLTLQAIRTIGAADLLLIPEKGAGKKDLADLRRMMLDTLVPAPHPMIAPLTLPVRDPAIRNYHARVEAWHDAIAALWERTIRNALPSGNGHVALMIWGDPSLYDSSLRIAARLAAHLPLQVEVVPGITSIQALCAAHAIPMNTLGGPVTITTGRQLRDHGWPPGAQTLVVMLDGNCAFQMLDPAGLHIAWTAFAGMPQEISLAGPLGSTGPQIISARAAARADHGWIMDIYRLTRSGSALA
ncbi:precorrin-6A synthase (deacetylating) [Falsirhodobacter sp. alg1]|uniref:precorrin-6A synthase (deacetylating) n=1 Tax=Falsirhodobacter sp. alg1 TaxID=1472418 RepID=UPI0005EE29A8|nr:precorrin-6A synthase (deacetylating) [Falsirhodobacter sp. alg1]